MRGRVVLIVEGNSVYEIDEECLKRKQKQEAEKEGKKEGAK